MLFYSKIFTGKALTANGERYCRLYGPNVNDMWFKQDIATCYTANATMNFIAREVPGTYYLTRLRCQLVT